MNRSRVNPDVLNPCDSVIDTASDVHLTPLMKEFDVAIVGTGRVGIAIGYYLVREHGVRRVALVDAREPCTDEPDGVDVLLDRALIRRIFPTLTHDVATVIHIRRTGSIDT